MKTRLPAVPLLLPLGALTAGILAAVFSDISYWWIAAGAAVAAIAAALLKARSAGAALIVFAAGAISGGLQKPDVPQALHGSLRLISGRVEEVKCGDTTQYLIVRADSVSGAATAPFRLRVTLRSATPPVVPGDMVRFRATLQSPRPATAQIPTGIDMEAWCLRNRIAALAPEVREKDFTITGYSPGLDTRMERWRNRLSDAILACGLAPDCAELTAALVTGDRRFLDPAMQNDFRGAGLAHVLALSGTHIAIIAFVVSLIFFPLRMAGRRNWQSLLTIAVLWGYAVFTGMAPSVVRAVIMATMLMAGRISGRHTEPLNTLCAAAVIILLFRPYDIFSIGFQLTFLAVGAILMFAGVASGIRLRWLRVPAQWVALSISAMAGTAPLAAWYFHTFPSNFLLSNLAMAILLPVFMAGGMLAALSGADLFVAGTDSVFDFCRRMAHTLAHAGAGEIGGITFSPWALIPYYLALGALWYAIRKRRIAYAVNSLLLLVAAGFIAGLPVYPQFEAFPAGSRYATVILAREGNNAYIFTDASPSTLRLIKRTVPYAAADYLSTRRTDTLRIAMPGLRTPHLRHNGNEWIVGNDRYVVLGACADTTGIRPQPDFLIISQGFTAPIKVTAAALAPRHVIISPRYNRRRQQAMSDSIRSLGYSVIPGY